jgi:hypothetical protein
MEIKTCPDNNSIKSSLQNCIDKLENIYAVENYCTNNILEGVTQYENEKYHFVCLHSKIENSWTEEYNLTLLNEKIFNLVLWNYDYWKEWSKQSEQSKIPHLNNYIIERKNESFDDMKKWYGNTELLNKAEQNYLNDIIINRYLKNTKPKYRLKGKFYINNNEYNIANILYENIHEYNIKVKWEI